MRIAVPVLLASLVLAACGKDEGDTVPPGQPAGPDDRIGPGGTTVGPSANRPVAAEVVMRNTEFVPPEVTVQAGENIAWENQDDFAHTVTAKSGADFDSGNVEGGRSYSYTAREAGTIEYVCTIHEGMGGRIIVNAP